MDGRTDGRTGGRTDGWTDRQMDGRTDRRTDGRTDGWMDEQIDTEVEPYRATDMFPKAGRVGLFKVAMECKLFFQEFIH